MRYGIRRASMADVADEAGLSRPALYQYFSGKDDLIAACFDLVTEDGFGHAEAALPPHASSRERVAAYLAAYMGFHRRLVVSAPHSDEVLELKTRFGRDKVVAAQARLVARINQLAGLPEDDETGAILAHGAEGLKMLAPDEATLTARIRRLVHALLG